MGYTVQHKWMMNKLSNEDLPANADSQDDQKIQNGSGECQLSLLLYLDTIQRSDRMFIFFFFKYNYANASV